MGYWSRGVAMKIFIWFLLILSFFVGSAGAVVFLEGGAPGAKSLPGSKTLHHYQTLKIRGVPVQGEVIEISPGEDPFETAQHSGKLLFKKKDAIGIKVGNLNILMKRISPTQIFKITLTDESFKKIFE